MSRLTVVVVSYETRDALGRCLEACERELPDARVIVVDNASSDGSPALVREAFPAVELVALPENAGFATGVNAGVARAQSDYVLVLNPDVAPEAEATARLVALLEERPGAAGAAPLLVGHDGRPQAHLYRRFPSVPQLTLFWTPLRPLAARLPALRHRWLHHDLRGDRPLPVDQLPGGAMLLRRSALRDVGPLDPDYFIWWEDVDWAYRARGRGLALFVDPGARFRHEGGTSFRAWPAGRRATQFYAAFFRFLCKHRLRRLLAVAAPLVRADLALKDAALTAGRLLGSRAAREAGSLGPARRAVRQMVDRCRAGELPALRASSSVPAPPDPGAPMGGATAPMGGATPAGPPVSVPPDSPVDVVIVNWNGGRYLPRALEAVRRSAVPARVIVVDNASTDDSVAIARAFPGEIDVVVLRENAGYAGGANVGVARGDAPFVLVMNPDVLLEPGYLAVLRDRLVAAPGVGAAQGKLYQVSPEAFAGGAPPERRLLDSAGHAILRSRAVRDRGQGEPDGPAYDQEGSVFSATGAALFLRRSMVESLDPEGRPFDESFFAYKEDIDLCWRARLRGWDIRYVPAAVAHHVRALPAGDRSAWRALPTAARRHSWKNHYLMLLKNDRIRDLLPALPGVLAWEVARLGYALARDPAVIPAYVDFWRQAPRALRERRRTLGAARAAGIDLRSWFGAGLVETPP
ncbi:MAG TPA: glycosyltransferase [Longimicrobiales bacterium]|nr:glycosyltransferase [Longimicrobiales bacterium]